METRSKRNVVISAANEQRRAVRVKIGTTKDNWDPETNSTVQRPREDERDDVPLEGHVEGLAREGPTQSSKIYVAARCAPLRFARTVASLSETKREAVKSLGLGGLLEIKPHSLDVQLIKNLVDRFDPANAILNVHDTIIQASVFEVGRLLGLLTEGLNVDEVCESDEGNLLVLWLKFNLGQGIIKLADLESGLADAEGDEFRSKFLLYAITAILSPSTSLNLKSKYVGLLEDLNICATMNWSKFTFDGLVDALQIFKSKKQSNDEHKHMGGCVMVLKLMYLERVVVRGGRRGPVLEREAPRVKDWTAEAIHKVMRRLKKTCSDFLDDEGIQVLDDVIGPFDVKGDVIALRKLIKDGFEEVHATIGRLVSRQEAIEMKLETLLARGCQCKGGHNTPKGIHVDEAAADDNIEENHQFDVGDDVANEQMQHMDVVDVPSSSRHCTIGDKPSFYDRVEHLNISTGGNNDHGKCGAFGDTSGKNLGDAMTKIRTTMRPSTRRERTCTGQVSAASSVALSKRPRTTVHAGMRNTDELKKGRVLKSPYQQIKTRAVKMMKKQKKLDMKQKQKDEGLLTWSEVSAMDTIELLDHPIEQTNLYVFSSSAKRGESELICSGRFAKLDRNDFKISLTPRSYLRGEVIDCVADLFI